MRDGLNVGAPEIGLGSAINFGTQTQTGVYTVIATNLLGCTNQMNGTATVSTGVQPSLFTVSGGGAFCTGGAGVNVGLSGSQTGVNYQLRRNSVNTGAPVAGSGSAISFGLQTQAGNYTVVATHTTGCIRTMTGSATITVNALPTVFNVTGGGGYCSGPGPVIGLSGSQTGVNYQLQRNSVNSGSTVAGTGSAISFGSRNQTGTYTVIATSTVAPETPTALATMTATAVGSPSPS